MFGRDEEYGIAAKVSVEMRENDMRDELHPSYASRFDARRVLWGELAPWCKVASVSFLCWWSGILSLSSRQRHPSPSPVDLNL